MIGAGNPLIQNAGLLLCGGAETKGCYWERSITREAQLIVISYSPLCHGHPSI